MNHEINILKLSINLIFTLNYTTKLTPRQYKEKNSLIPKKAKNNVTTLRKNERGIFKLLQMESPKDRFFWESHKLNNQKSKCKYAKSSREY